jgi:uridine phosphorylase
VSIHIRPTAPLAERALLPADPGVALALAQALLVSPRMFNHSHGLWGYTGLAADGDPMTIQATGIGGPSAVIVLDDLIALGLRRAIRVGACVGLPTTDGSSPRIGLGDVVIAEAAVCADGTSRTLGAGKADATANAGLTRAIGGEARRGRVISTDLLYGPDADRLLGMPGRGVLAAEMAAAALFTLGVLRRIAVGCVLVVSERLTGTARERLDDESLAAAYERAGRLAAAGLG